MAYRAELTRILNPYSLLAYCAIFLVVRGEDAKESALDDHGDLIDEAILSSELSSHIERCQDVKPKTSELKSETVVEDLKQDDFSSEEEFKSYFDETVGNLSPLVEKIQNEMCRKHSRLFLRQLRRYKMWAMQMYDSSAKLPSGILKGNTNQLGDFDQCLSVSSTVEEGVGTAITGQYCLAQVDVAARNGSDALLEAVARAQGLGFITSTVYDPGHFIPQFTSINWAVCLPSSCDAADLEATLADALDATPGLRFTVRVDPNMCYVKERKSWTTATIATIWFFGLIGLLALVASLKDCVMSTKSTPTGKLSRMVTAFSLQRNWASLWAELPEEDIHCIHGIRAICTIMLYAAHKVIPLALTPISNRVKLTELSFEPPSIFLRTSLIYTDSFLLLSGVLTAYNLAKEVHRTKRIEWTKRYAARFIRLTPALLALVVFYAYVWEHLGNGPLWNRVVKQNADICKDNMWTNVLYIQNFFPFQQMCATHTHQLALDMQLSLLSPLLVYLLYRHLLLGVAALAVLHAATAVLRYVVVARNSLALLIYHGMPLSQLYTTANLSYSLSSHRATPYLVGIGVGYFLYKYQKTLHIPKLASLLGWLVAAGGVYMSVVSPAHVADKEFVYDVADAAAYAAYSSVTWSVALGWVICACALGHGGFLNRMLCCKWMVFMSKISYSFYLMQFAVFFYNIGSLRSSQEFLIVKLMSLEEVVIVVAVSVVMTMLFDLPMQELKGILTGGGRKSGKSTKCL